LLGDLLMKHQAAHFLLHRLPQTHSSILSSSQSPKGFSDFAVLINVNYNSDMDGRVYLSASTDAVDAACITKEHAVRDFAKTAQVSLSKIGAIGDSANDLPFLTIPNLGLIGAPLNAQPRVRATVANLKNSIQLSTNFVEAFLEFYRAAEQRGILYIFAGKDGVLAWRQSSAQQLAGLNAIFRVAGFRPHPFVFVLTGSSYEQNIQFLHSAGLDRAFAQNPKVREHPSLVLAENGAVQINALTGEARENRDMLDLSLIAWLKGSFERDVVLLVEKEVLPRFKLTWSSSADDQVQSVWLPRNQTMVTMNIPKISRDGRDYRMSARGTQLGHAILNCMVKVTEASDVPYTIL